MTFFDRDNVWYAWLLSLAVFFGCSVLFGLMVAAADRFVVLPDEVEQPDQIED